jgi:hypothetical protein
MDVLETGIGVKRRIRSGRSASTVVRCGLTDPIASDLAVSVVFFFDRALDSERLADGLARALDRLPVFAGRLRDRPGAPDIVCADQGVPMTVADVDRTLHDMIGAATRVESGLVDHVDADSARAGDGPLLTVRISRLRDGGTALGCSWHHLVGDMHTFMLLMRSWSAFVDGGEQPEVTVVKDRTAYLDTVLPAMDAGQPSYRLMDAAEAAEMGAALRRAMSDSTVAQLYFSDAEVNRMRELLGARTGRWLSANDVLCAHIVDTLCVLEKDADARFLDFPVNIRSRLRLPSSIAGNLLTVIDLPREPGTPPEAFAAAIRTAVDNVVDAHLNLRADLAFVREHGWSRVGEFMFRGIDPRRRAIILTNWGGFDVYGLTFGGCRPMFFGPTPTPTSFHLPWIGVLFQGFAGTGQLCTLALPNVLAESLRQPDGQAVLHRFRAAEDVLPRLARSVPALL